MYALCVCLQHQQAKQMMNFFFGCGQSLYIALHIALQSYQCQEENFVVRLSIGLGLSHVLCHLQLLDFCLWGFQQLSGPTCCKSCATKSQQSFIVWKHGPNQSRKLMSLAWKGEWCDFAGHKPLGTGTGTDVDIHISNVTSTKINKFILSCWKLSIGELFMTLTQKWPSLG